MAANRSGRPHTAYLAPAATDSLNFLRPAAGSNASGITVDALRMRLGRADTAIAAALAAGDLTDTISTASRRDLDSKTKARLALRARARRHAATGRITLTLRQAAA